MSRAALTNNPPTCFLAVQERSIVGFACHDATAKGFFGPTGVVPEHQGKGVGRALLLVTLHATRELRPRTDEAVMRAVPDEPVEQRRALEPLVVRHVGLRQT